MFVLDVVVLCFFFFFSSRRRHTRFDCDWSSDVCSSDLPREESPPRRLTCRVQARCPTGAQDWAPSTRRCPIRRGSPLVAKSLVSNRDRSEERRVGKECRSRGSAHQ